MRIPTQAHPLIYGLVLSAILVVVFNHLIPKSSPPPPPQEVNPAAATPPPLTAPRERETVYKAWLETPKANGWKISPALVNSTYRGEGPQFLMNLAFVEKVEGEILGGSRNIGSLFYRINRAESDSYAFPLTQKSRRTLRNYEGECLYVFGNTYADELFKNKYTVTFQAELMSDGVPLRTERRIAAGETATWGPVFTKRPWVGRIFFLSDRFQGIDPSRFQAAPPRLILEQAGEADVPSDQIIECYEPVIALTSTSPGVADGRVLKIEIPDEFGGSFVLVNFFVK